MCLASPILADEEELYFEPNETMDLKVYCFDVNNSFCNSTTNCQITIFYPNSTRYAYNQSMDYSNNYFNYTANASETLGAYSTIAYCQSGGSEGYLSFDFYVGRPSTDPQIKTTILGIVILLSIAALFFIGFLFIKKDLFKWSFFLFAILFFVITINIVSISLRNEAGSENIRNIFDKIGAVSYYMYWMCFGLIAIIWMFAVIMTIGNKWKMRRAAQVGQPMDFSKY